LNEGLTQISENSFANTKCLNEITLPSTLTSIPTFAFTGSAISKINFGGVTSIGGEAFYNCDDYSLIDMSESKITTIASFAFSSMKKTAFNTFITGSELTSFKDAFSTCGYINSFDMSKSTKVTTIDSGFLGESSTYLKTLILPSSLTELPHDTLGTFPKLTDLKFTGTVAQWNALMDNAILTKQEKIDNPSWGEWFGSNYDTLTSITCNYGQSAETSYPVSLRDTKGKISIS